MILSLVFDCNFILILDKFINMDLGNFKRGPSLNLELDLDCLLKKLGQCKDNINQVSPSSTHDNTGNT